MIKANKDKKFKIAKMEKKISLQVHQAEINETMDLLTT